MDIVVNGTALDLGTGQEGKLGEALAAADDLIEKSGGVIVGISVDGEPVRAEGYAAVAERPASSVGRVEISAESSLGIRTKALETLIELIGLAKEAAAGAEGAAATVDWAALRAGASDLGDAFAGLFAADELSLVQSLSSSLERAGDEPSRDARAEIRELAERLGPVFKERLAELAEPEREMRSAAALFAAQESELAELPVLLQTGREDRAMKVVLYFIEIFNKVIRIIPELKRKGVATESLLIDGRDLAEFYGAFNGVLRELTAAFENGDAVLIGDIAEYEVLPRMKNFFAAMEGALDPL